MFACHPDISGANSGLWLLLRLTNMNVVFVLWAPAHGNDRVSKAGTMGLLLRATEERSS